MLEPLVTTAIVRRYLTAIGAPVGDVDMVCGLLLELNVVEVLDVIVALPEGPATEFEVHEALVLCAVAEEALTGYRPHYEVIEYVTAKHLAKRFIERAGLTLEAWEATR